MENLNAKLKACAVFVVNGETYFGKAKTDPENKEKLIVTETVDSVKKDFKQTLKNWIKASNSGRLQKFTVTGMLTLAERPLTPEQEMQIDSVAAQAVYIMENTLADLQNAKIDEI